MLKLYIYYIYIYIYKIHKIIYIYINKKIHMENNLKMKDKQRI